jgi:hypothetical protein
VPRTDATVVRTGADSRGYSVLVEVTQSEPGSAGASSSDSSQAGRSGSSSPPPSSAGRVGLDSPPGASSTRSSGSTTPPPVVTLVKPEIHSLLSALLPTDDNSIPQGWQKVYWDHPNASPYEVFVNGSFTGIAWLPNGPAQSAPQSALPALPGAPPAGNGNSTDAYQVALFLLDTLSLPPIQIGVNPSAQGLVNVPSWFWVSGYGGGSFGDSRSVTVPPAVGPDVPFIDVPADDPRRQPTTFTVTVQAGATDYVWRFGDGSFLETHSLGTAFPAESEIQHTYTASSFGAPNGYPVTLTVVFSASYSVSSGGGGSLPAIANTYSLSYPVEEVQAVLTR